MPIFMPATILRGNALVSASAGTVIGNMTTGGGLTSAFDGNTNQSNGTGAERIQTSSPADSIVGKDWGAGVAKVITRFRAYGGNGTTNSCFFTNADSGAVGTLQGSHNGSSWINLYSAAIPNANSSAGPWDISFGIDVTTPYRYHRFKLNSTQSSGSYRDCIAELEFFEG